MSLPVRLSRSRRILSRSGSRSSIRSNSPSAPSSSSSSSKFATPRASVHDDPDDSLSRRPSLGVRRSPSPSRSRRSRASAKSASRRPSTSRSSDGAPDNVQEVRQASPNRIRPPKQTRFGIPAPTNQPRIIGNFDFEELGPNARVWRANLDECEVFDNDMVTEARDGLDLMLVFAGLFSAVLSTFVAQTSQALSNNFPAVSTALLLEMVTLQRALIKGSSIDDVSTSEMTSGPSGFDIWVNALWFISLTLSLGTSRPFRGVAFLVRTFLSSATAASAIVKHFSHSFQTWVTSKMTSVATLVRKFVYLKFVFKFAPTFALKLVRDDTDPNFFSPSTTIPSSKKFFKALKEAERIAATSDDVAEEVASDALMWLYRMTSNPPTKRVVLQSIGCLSDKVSERLTAISVDMEDALGEIQHPANGAVDVWTIIPGQETRAEKLLRSDRHSHHDRGKFWLLEKRTCEHHFQLPLSILTHPRTTTIQFTLGGSWECRDFLIHVVQYDMTGGMAASGEGRTFYMFRKGE